MSMQPNVEAVKLAVQKSIGKDICFTSKKGRKKALVRHGVIEQVFPSIFIIRLHPQQGIYGARRVSYSYTDVLTKSIELALC